MARDNSRIQKILSTVKEAWEKNPDMRLTQLILNTDAHYHTEDDVLEERIKNLYLKNS